MTSQMPASKSVKGSFHPSNTTGCKSRVTCITTCTYSPISEVNTIVCPIDPLIEYVEGEVLADANDRNGCPIREADFCDVGKGVAKDFQYVSTAPPISSVTPRNGVTILTSKETLFAFISLFKVYYIEGGGGTYLPNYMKVMIENRQGKREFRLVRTEHRRQCYRTANSFRSETRIHREL